MLASSLVSVRTLSVADLQRNDPTGLSTSGMIHLKHSWIQGWFNNSIRTLLGSPSDVTCLQSWAHPYHVEAEAPSPRFSLVLSQSKKVGHILPGFPRKLHCFHWLLLGHICSLSQSLSPNVCYSSWADLTHMSNSAARTARITLGMMERESLSTRRKMKG